MNPWMEAQFTKTYPGVAVQGEFCWMDRPRRVTALFGPSGCGKTTVLRCLAGLERLNQGSIRAFDQTWSHVEQRIHLAPQQRRVGFLFQDYMLFPHLNVRDNIGFGTPAHLDLRPHVDQLLQRFQLTGLDRRLPRELSGGQQQRVALARVLAAQPRLLCLDEPLSALDGPTRADLRIALREWLQELQLPALIVSHDVIEVQALADDLVVMSEGRPRQSGPVAEVLHCPLDRTVARIVGFENFLPVTVLGRRSDGLSVEHDGWRFRGIDQRHTTTATSAIACSRAEAIQLRGVASDSSAGTDEPLATLLELIPEGAMLRARLMLGSGNLLQALIPRSATSQAGIAPGDLVHLDISVDAAIIVTAD